MNNINNNNINEVQWPLKKFEDTKGLIRNRKQKKDRQKKTDKDTNYNKQDITHKKIEIHEQQI